MPAFPIFAKHCYNDSLNRALLHLDSFGLNVYALRRTWRTKRTGQIEETM